MLSDFSAKIVKKDEDFTSSSVALLISLNLWKISLFLSSPSESSFFFFGAYGGEKTIKPRLLIFAF